MANKKGIIQKISHLEEQIRRHEEKLSKDPDSQYAGHWRKEIMNFEREVERLRRMLKEGGYEEYCPTCGKVVVVRNKMCSRCRAYLG